MPMCKIRNAPAAERSVHLGLSKKYYFFDKGICGLTAARTFAGREVFSPPHMSPEKMLGLSFAAASAKLYEVF